VLSVPMEAINEAASCLLDRCLTDATGTRPDTNRSRGGRTRTSDAPKRRRLQGDRDSCRSFNAEPSEGSPDSSRRLILARDF